MITAIALVIATILPMYADDKATADELLRRSKLFEKATFNPQPNPQSSYPAPFVKTGAPIINPANSPQVSTGYYFVDNMQSENAPSYWRPDPVWVDDTSENANLWFDVVTGPNQKTDAYWVENKDNGKRFFRAPDTNNQNSNDSTDDAFAGPIPIGFPFYFNGLRYDSFYVGTNGIIALSNRRYFYNDLGQRTIPAGATTCYDPMSMDWFRRYRNGNGLYDNTSDNFGFRYAVLDNGNPAGGIRAKGGALNGAAFAANNRAALIAPFFGDMQLSQYWASQAIPDNCGHVKFRRSLTTDKLIIWFINIVPVNGIVTPYGPFNCAYDLRSGERNYCAGSGQVTLNRMDSSITIQYGTFDGGVIVNNRFVPANTVFRWNTTVGVRGFARHINYHQGKWNLPASPTEQYSMYPWAVASKNGEYEQFTHYFNNLHDTDNYPVDYGTIRFKQWKNLIRVVDIHWRVRDPNPKSDMTYSIEVPSSKANGYELLAGDDRIGSIQPVSIFQNMSNDIQGPQGVNYVPQQLSFKTRFKVINEATTRMTFTSLMNVDSTCLALPKEIASQCADDPNSMVRYVSTSLVGADYTAASLRFPDTTNLNGIPPYGFVQVYFTPFNPSETAVSNIGRLRCFVISDPYNPATAEPLGEQFPFDDTISNVELFSMKRLDDPTNPFYDDFSQFHIINLPSGSRVAMPSTLKWVNFDAEIASAEAISNFPLPPRGIYQAANNDDFGIAEPDYKTTNQIQSPCLRMNRINLDGSENPGAGVTTPNGDEVRSFPINLSSTASRPTLGAALSLSVQRSVKQNDWPRGWCDATLIGCELRAFINSNPLHNWTEYYIAYNIGTHSSASHFPDEFRVDFAKNFFPDGVPQVITNIPKTDWLYHPVHGGNAITNMSAFLLYGGGGALRGYDENEKDSALIPPTASVYNGLRPDRYDDGIDFEYNRIFVAIPDTFINAPNDAAHNFRFRLKVSAYNNSACIGCIPDDDDPFIVDNVKILLPSEITDIEISTVKAIWPYTLAPLSQTINIPLQMKISNNTTINAPRFIVKMEVFRNGQQNNPRLAIYCRTQVIPFLPPGQTKVIDMPPWDARGFGNGNYIVKGTVFVPPSGDLDPRNDTTYSAFVLRTDSVFAYDQPGVISNVSDIDFANLTGKGLSIYAFADGGNGHYQGGYTQYDELNSGTGTIYSAGNGEIAVRFTLFQADTIKGYQAWFDNLNSAMDDIQFCLYPDVAGIPGTPAVDNSTVYKRRAFDDIRQAPYYKQYVTYKLDKPVVLPAGTYWASIGQMAVDGIELGAVKSRSGLRTTNPYFTPPSDASAAVQPMGSGNVSLACDKSFRTLDIYNHLVNDNCFCEANTINSNAWSAFFPTIGNPAYAHLNAVGITPRDYATATLSRGAWIPMIRPYLGLKTYKTNSTYSPCDTMVIDTSGKTPIQISNFNGNARTSGIDLFWETASEVNNFHFNVERRISGTEDWKLIANVPGAVNSQSVKHYSFIDKNVNLNTTYEYRIGSTDLDGTQQCNYSNIVVLEYDKVAEVTVYPNSPNPFTTSTVIKYILPENGMVKLDILDVFGNVVRTLVNTECSAGNNQAMWDCTDNNHNLVTSGSYMFRLSIGDKTLTGKMSLVR